jgi:hypothetical protein
MNPTFTITDLSVDEVNLILAGLQEIPVAAKITSPLTQKVKEQAEEQLKIYQESQQQPAAEK